MRRLFLALVGLFVAVGVWCQEYQVDSSTEVGTSTTPGTEFSLSQRLDLGAKFRFDQAGGGFTVKAHLSGGVPGFLGADLDELAVTMVFKDPAPEVKTLKWTLGRFVMSEPTGLILNHPGDGISLDFLQSGWDLSVFAGYTGLVMRSSSGISLTSADAAEADDLLASPRLVGGLTAAVGLPAGHDLNVSMLAQQDLHRTGLVDEWGTVFDAEKGGRLDTQYLTIHADGPLSQGLFYDAFFTFGSGSTLSWIKNTESPTGYQYEYRPIVSLLTGLQVQYFLPALFSSSYGVRVLAASGDSDASSAIEGNTKDWSTTFVPVTGSSLGTVFNPGLSNLIAYEFAASLRPLSSIPLVTEAKILGFQRAVAGVVNAGVLRNGPLWMGQEVDINVTWKPLSDVSVSASVGAFIPTAGTFASDSPGAGFQSAAKVGATLSL